MPNVTASFQLFSIDGLQIAFSLVGETETPAQWVDAHLAGLYKAGYRTEPVEGNLKPQTVPIVGYVRTTTQDPNNPGQYKPALALFSPWGDFTAITVYAEKLPELPFVPTGKVWDGGAFDRNLITSKGYLTKCDMKIVKEPILDFEGKPKLTEAGNQKWRFVKVIELNGEPVTEDTKPAPGKPAQDEPETSQGNGGQSSKPAASKPAQPAAPAGNEIEQKKAIYTQCLTIAKKIYGEAAADGALKQIGAAVAKQEIAGLSKLTIAQLEHVRALVQLDEAGINEYGDVVEWQEALAVLLPEWKVDSVYALTPHQLSRLHATIAGDDSKIPF